MNSLLLPGLAADHQHFPPYSCVHGDMAVSAEIGLLPSLPCKKFLGLINGKMPVNMPLIADEAITYTSKYPHKYGQEEWMGVYGGYFDEFGPSRHFENYLTALRAASRSLPPEVREHCIANLESWEITLHVADATAEDGVRDASLNAYTLAQLDAVATLLHTSPPGGSLLWTLPPEPGLDEAPDAMMGEKTIVEGSSIIIDFLDYHDDEDHLTPDGHLPTHSVTVDRAWFVQAMGDAVDRTRDRISRMQRALRP